jgi:hypothetical protein
MSFTLILDLLSVTNCQPYALEGIQGLTMTEQIQLSGMLIALAMWFDILREPFPDFPAVCPPDNHLKSGVLSR